MHSGVEWESLRPGAFCPDRNQSAFRVPSPHYSSYLVADPVPHCLTDRATVGLANRTSVRLANRWPDGDPDSIANSGPLTTTDADADCRADADADVCCTDHTR